MESFKKSAVAAFLSALSMSAFGMTPVGDEELSQVAGRSGVSFVSLVNASVGTFSFTDTDPDGGSIRFGGLGAFGLVGGAIDIVNQSTFESSMKQYGVQLPASFYKGGDVIQMSFPSDIVMPTAMLMDVWANSMRMGGNLASFGKVQMSDVDIRGTTVWVWKH
jgi:hypothetical protein